MPRKGWVLRRKIPGDPVYGSDLVQKFISSMMYDGKRSTAQTIFYNAMDQVAKKTNDDAFKLFKKAIENCKPGLEVKSRRGEEEGRRSPHGGSEQGVRALSMVGR